MSKQKKKRIKINTKAKNFKDRYPMVECRWIDICSDASWMSLDHLASIKPPLCVTKGHLLSQAKGVTRIFGDYSLDDEGNLEEVGNATAIPNSVIQEIIRI